MRSEMRIEIVKQSDGAGVLRCIRADGSVTWQKQARHAAHFALHDLTHFAVETALDYQQGFFGLVAAGWEVEDTTGQSGRVLPDEALEVEKMVGLFDAERASGVVWSAEEFGAFAPRALSEDELRRVRALRAELFGQWAAIAPGEKLGLTFGGQACASASLVDSDDFSYQH